MTHATPSAAPSFVDRAEEMSRIVDSLKLASTGEGQLLLIRGEAGSGKTRLMQEAAAEAEKQGFSIGFGTALAESVIPYHAWKEVLEGLSLDAILEEVPPPKLLGLYLLDAEGRLLVQVKREGIGDGRLTSSVDILKEYVQGSLDPKDCKWAEGQLAVMQEDDNRILVSRDASYTVGAILEGKEDEKFLADLQALTNTIASNVPEQRLDADLAAAEEPLRQLLESRKYEGIDYVQDDPKLRQARFFEQVTLGLTRRASHHPICVVIDDLQWADPSSLDLLHYVTRNTHEASVLLLGTYRIEEAKSRTRLRDVLKGIEEEDLVTEMDLEGLAQLDLADLAESFIGSHGLPGAFIDCLWRETRGNPLFVREVLRGLEEDSAITQKGGVKRLDCPIDQLALPERVREVIRTRLERLPEEDRRLLDVAATCGTRFTAALVAKATGETEGNVLNGLSAIARVHGLLRPTDSGFTFDHPAVQEVLYDGVPIETRQTYHKEAAEWLELAGGPVEDIGEHYYKARDPRATAMLSEAASSARTRYANEEAIRFYTEALELEEDAKKRMGIFEGIGSVYTLIGDNDKALASFERALGLTEEKRKAAEIKAKIGRAYWIRGEYAETIKISTEALNSVVGEGCKEEADALYSLGFAHKSRGDSDKALEAFENSLEISDKIGDQSGTASNLNCIGLVHQERGDFDKALEYLQKSLAIHEKIGNQLAVAGSLSNIGVVHQERGDYNKALEYLYRSAEISERIGHQSFLAAHLNNIGSVHGERGNHDRALEFFKKSLTIYERMGDPGGIARLSSCIGYLYIVQRDYDTALEYLPKSLGIYERIGHQRGVAHVSLNFGHLHIGRRDYDKALGYLQKSLGIQLRTGHRLELSETYHAIAEVYLLKGAPEEALGFCNDALALSTEMGQKLDIALSGKILGMICREQERWKESTESFEKSIGILEELGNEHDLGDTHYEFGLMCIKKGEPTRAREHLDVAIGIYEKLNLAKDLKAAEDAYESVVTELSPEVREEG